MNRHVPFPTSLDVIETAVWAAEFTRVRGTRINTDTGAIDRSDFAIDQAINSANEAIDDMRKAYKR